MNPRHHPGAAIRSDNEEQEIALEYLALAWSHAEDQGVNPEAIARAALFAALASLVRTHGEDATGDLVAGLPIRIRSGEYSLDKTVQ